MSEASELKFEPKLFQNGDNQLFSFNYIQNEEDTPFLNVRDDPTTDSKEEENKTSKPKIYKLKFELYSVSTANVHKKLKTATIE